MTRPDTVKWGIAACALVSGIMGPPPLFAQTGERCPCAITRQPLVELGDPSEPDGSINAPWAGVYQLDAERWVTVDFYLPFAFSCKQRPGGVRHQ